MAASMLVTARSFAEYEAMFDLAEPELSGSVLDCCAGISGFVAELAGRGGRGIAADPAYARPRTELNAVVDASLHEVDRIVDSHADRFTWEWYGSVQRRAALRHAAAAGFLADFGRRPARYVGAALPELPFADHSFDLVLCSHLLFTWANEFDARWHLAALTELTRVAKGEVRVYPLVMQGAGDRVPFFDQLLADLREQGHEVRTRPVPFRFQRGADSMLVVRPAGATRWD